MACGAVQVACSTRRLYRRMPTTRREGREAGMLLQLNGLHEAGAQHARSNKARSRTESYLHFSVCFPVDRVPKHSPLVKCCWNLWPRQGMLLYIAGITLLDVTDRTPRITRLHAKESPERPQQPSSVELQRKNPNNSILILSAPCRSASDMKRACHTVNGCTRHAHAINGRKHTISRMHADVAWTLHVQQSEHTCKTPGRTPRCMLSKYPTSGGAHT
jgi:hypothetical protein